MYNNLAVSRPGVCDKVRRAGDYRPTRATVCNSYTLCGIVKEARLDSETRVVPVCFFFFFRRRAHAGALPPTLSGVCDRYGRALLQLQHLGDAIYGSRFRRAVALGLVWSHVGDWAVSRNHGYNKTLCIRSQILLSLGNLSLMSERLKVGRHVSPSFSPERGSLCGIRVASPLVPDSPY